MIIKIFYSFYMIFIFFRYILFVKRGNLFNFHFDTEISEEQLDKDWNIFQIK